MMGVPEEEGVMEGVTEPVGVLEGVMEPVGVLEPDAVLEGELEPETPADSVPVAVLVAVGDADAVIDAVREDVGVDEGEGATPADVRGTGCGRRRDGVRAL